MKKILISVVGGFLVLLGLVFIIVPGPSMLLLIPGLFILSYEYPLAKVWLRKCQRLLRRGAVYLDKLTRKLRYSR